jgi:ABC-type branched-subunit amino acid transport system ATPase component
VREIGDIISFNREENLTVILIEQKLKFARRVSQLFTCWRRAGSWRRTRWKNWTMG